MKQEAFSGENPIIQDKAFVRHVLEEFKQARVKRWKKEDDFIKFVPKEYHANRNENNLEHTGGMRIVADLVFQKAEAEGDETVLELDYRRVGNLIRVHDLEETYVGDERVKDDDYYAREKVATAQLHKNNTQVNFGSLEDELIAEYQEKKTKESRFVKAIDELQAWLYLISKRDIGESNRGLEGDNALENIKGYEYAQEFPTVKRVMDIVIHVMQRPELIKSGIPDMPE